MTKFIYSNTTLPGDPETPVYTPFRDPSTHLSGVFLVVMFRMASMSRTSWDVLGAASYILSVWDLVGNILHMNSCVGRDMVASWQGHTANNKHIHTGSASLLLL